MENENWVPVPSIAGAKASTMGRVIMPPKVGVVMPTGGVRNYKTSPRTGCIDKTSTSRSSKKRFIIRHDGKTYKVHRLICEAFHGLAPNGKPIVLHIDEDPTNNRPENLRWGTRKENQNFPKVKEAFRARVGCKSAWAIHFERKKADENYKSRSGLN